jgi:hypothetical protein
MAIEPPRLDDRAYDDLVADLRARIPAHTPEWTPQPGDPGLTLLELFAWLADTILYRANLVPERTRLAFLALLGERLRPAEAARGLVALALDEPVVTALELRAGATLDGPVPFETLDEVSVLPVQAICHVKRPAPADPAIQRTLEELKAFYRLEGEPRGYVTTPLFTDGRAVEAGIDIVAESLDRSLWLALLAPSAAQVAAVRTALGGEGAVRLLDLGVVPGARLATPFPDLGGRARIPFAIELTTGREVDSAVDTVTLDVVADGTDELSVEGVVRVALPGIDNIGAPSNDVVTAPRAGVGERPPRLDDPELAARLVAWLRLRPTTRVERWSLAWAGINAVAVDQRATRTDVVLGQGTGAPDLRLAVPATSIDPASFALEVEETDRGFVPWEAIDDLGAAAPDEPRFELDAAAGAVTFGDGVRGSVPERGARVRAARYRAGGGTAGNLAAGTLTTIAARTLDGASASARLRAVQPAAMRGGADAETLAEAERRLPERLRHRERAVTAADYESLARTTPGLDVGRIEVLPLFKPQQRRRPVPGVVSVLALPALAGPGPRHPRPDRPFLEAVFRALDPRRPLATELYVIGADYVPIGVGVGVTVRAGFGRQQVIHDVQAALRRALWPLAPGGVDERGWPLGGTVRDRFLEVVVARVGGVAGVRGIELFTRADERWTRVPRASAGAPATIELADWQLPELARLLVVADDDPPDELTGAPDPFGGDGGGGVAVPIVPEVC